MTLTFPLLDQPLRFVENQVNVLVIESPSELRRFLYELSEQIDGSRGGFVLAENYTPVELGDAAALITDPFHPDLGSRKLSNRINQIALETAEEHTEAVRAILSAINELAAEISCELEFDAAYDELESPAELIRILGFRLDREALGFSETLLEWMRLQRMFFRKRLFIFYGLKACLEPDELASFYRSIFYEKLDVLLIEPFQRSHPFPQEFLTIIDKDLCVIQ